MDKDTTKLALTHYLKPFSHKFFSTSIQEHGLDRYVKKLTCLSMLKLFTFAQMMQISSYSDISLSLERKKKLQKVIGITSISTAQLSRRWRDQNYSLLAQSFTHMVEQVVRRFGLAKAGSRLNSLQLIDASVIILCLSQYRWASYSKHKAGIKMHLRFVNQADVSYPDKVILTPAKVADPKEMDSLVVTDPEVLNVFDRGYVDYRKFDSYTKQGTRFVTRLRHNADYKVIEERACEPDSGIQRDAIIWLGYRNTRYVMKNHLRLVECVDSNNDPFLVFTNDFNMAASEIAEIYRKRWKIELFFKWIKQNLTIKRCYGHSRNAVYNQVLIAIIAYCITLLMQADLMYQGRMLTVIKQLRQGWDEGLEQLIQQIFRPPRRTSAGRSKSIDVEQTYREICYQYEMGRSRCLNEWSIDIFI